jgi:hypothetical protein
VFGDTAPQRLFGPKGGKETSEWANLFLGTRRFREYLDPKEKEKLYMEKVFGNTAP